MTIIGFDLMFGRIGTGLSTCALMVVIECNNFCKYTEDEIHFILY